MSSPLNAMPELRATFRADSSALLDLATKQLALLNQPGSDFSPASALRNTIHSLRGAAAMIGAQPLTALIDDYQRLLEVADSFKLTARDQALQAYAFLQKQLDRLRRALHATLEDKPEVAQECFEQTHREALAAWGDYFYSAAPESEGPGSDKPGAKPATKVGKGGWKPGAARRADPDAIAREFLTSLGVDSTAPPPPTSSTPVTDSLAVLDQFDPEMLSYFVLETNESLTQLETLLLAWEKSPDDARIPHSVFRLIHTIKGAANSLGLNRIGRLLHGLEDLMETHVVDRVFPHLTELVELILTVADTVKALVRETQTGVTEPANAERLSTLTDRIQLMARSPVPPARADAVEPFPASTAEPLSAAQPVASDSHEAPTPQTAPAPAVPEPAVPAEAVEARSFTAEKADALEHSTIRVESDRLDLLMNLIGELVISRSRLEKKLMDISRLREEMLLGKARLFQAITDFQERYEYSRPALERNRLGTAPGLTEPGSRSGAELGASNLSGFSELEFDQYDEFNILARTLTEIGTDTGEIFTQLNRFFDAFGEETGQFSKITARLQDEITRVRMMPLTLLFQRLRRAARDASRKEGKPINFVTVDNDTRLDKMILDQLYTPLLHIVRNAVSHGIEAAEQRRADGKEPTGQLHLRAACEANHVILEVADDGCGLDLQAIRETAVRRGFLAPEATPDEETLIQFIFQPGFSTAANVTDVSGRGVGLDVVRQEIARLSGSVQVRSTPGRGCTFVIHLPLTLAINQAMFITAGSETCALPLNFVERIKEGQSDDFAYSGQQELVRTPEGMVPLLRLNRLLNVNAAPGEGSVVLARVADRRIAIGVDRILRKQDIVVKPLGPLLQGHPLFSGATLGGDGQVVMILDLPRLIENEQTAALEREFAGGESALEVAGEATDRPTILVVDDSLSVRKVIEKHLQSLQYRVELAVDGLDALEKLRARRISLVLTDLEMPRMHGFELIAEMRRHDALRSLPIIVVTSRDADKHRRRATSLGANDYIIKPFSREQLGKHIHQLLAKANR